MKRTPCIVKALACLSLIFISLLYTSGCATEYEEICEPAPSIFTYYKKTSDTSFAHLEVIELHEEIFYTSDRDPIPLFIATCRVIEDFYDYLTPDTVILLPIRIDRHIGAEDYLTEEYFDLLSSTDTFYACFHKTWQRIIYQSGGSSLETEIWPVALWQYELLPVTEGRVYPSNIDPLIDPERGEPYRDRLLGMNEFCYDGIPCEEFEENIRNLSDELDEQAAKAEQARNERSSITFADIIGLLFPFCLSQ